MQRKTPVWWTVDHDQRWDRVRASFRRSWEWLRFQTESVAPQASQQFASEPAPCFVRPARSFEDLESAFRYGHLARQQFPEIGWDDRADRPLRRDYPGNWNADRDYIRSGFNYPARH